MKPERLQGFQCWDSQRIGQVINKEATSLDTATFMATHTPFSKLNYQRYLQQMTDTSEEGLLHELQRCAEHDIHVFMAIHGIPGSGKSHLIRWLKERFQAAHDETECVIFIERSQCSLRSTLEQIINSGVFQDMMMHKQLEKLENARGELSKEAFAQQLLNQFFVESIESSAQYQIRPPHWLNKEKLEAFIYDLNVRRQLLKPGGPIDRIVHFLTGGSGITRSSDSPAFFASDFDFLGSTYSNVAGYPSAREVIKQLHSGHSRHALARYFTELLPHVIGHATTLTGDDFKRIFLDLRRELRNHGRNLALFIEDITALTGINLGLLDVLVAQHVGDLNQNLCRVISVLGITNNYFSDHFPDHMKDRLTHCLTLNAAEDDENISDTEMLGNEDATAEMAARYLNAIRLKAQDIQQWSQSGSKPEFMPNACDRCAVKETCHRAFGYERVVVSPEKELHVGIYPFNTSALWNFYRHIPERRRTPRSFLHNVLYYILQSHGEKIRFQQFPPAPVDLGGEFETFLLSKPSHRSLIEAQGGLDAKRIETLVTIWGDGTIDAYEEEQTLFVGSLSTAVFIAFGIKPIEGQRLTVATDHRSQSHLPALTTRVRERSLVEAATSKTISPPTLFPKKDLEALQDDRLKHHSEYIVDWLHGKQLRDHEYYTNLLIPVIRDFINWDVYEVSTVQISEALNRRYIYIEDQDGKKPSYALTFQRSTELANILQALVEIKEYGQLLKGEELGTHVSNMSIWLHRHEEAIVRFVRQPNHESTNALPFVTVLILDCLLMACLAGELDVSRSSATGLLRDLIGFCKNTTATTWEKYQSLSTKARSTAWTSSMKRLKPSQVASLCSLLPHVLNCAQGNSSEVLFIDAATALNVLEAFQGADWQLLPSGCVGKPLQDKWKDILSTYDLFYNQFKLLIQEECQSIQELIARLDGFIGNDAIDDVFQAIEDMLQVLRDSQRGTKFTVDKALNANDLKTLLVVLRDVVKEQKFATLTLKLSQVGPQVASAREYIEYFSNFEKEALLQRQKAQQRLASQKDFSQEVSQKQEVVLMAYQEIISELNKLAMKEDA